MAQSSTKTGAVVPTTCHACGSERELVRSGDRTAARCVSCGKLEDVAVVCAALEKWSVVGPDGKVQTFATKAELVELLQGAAPSSRASGATARIIDDSSTEVADVLSVRDVTLVPVPPVPPSPKPVPNAPPPPPPPLPPKARALSRLEPPKRHDAPPPPPPSIDLGDASTSPVDDLALALPVSEIPSPLSQKASVPPGWLPATVPAAAKEEEDPKRAWLLPAAALALVVGSIAYAVRSSPTPDAGSPSQTTATPPAVTAAVVEASAAASAPLAAASTSAPTTTVAVADAAVADAATAKPSDGAKPAQAAVDDKTLPLSELLSRAAAAKRSSDFARAKILLDRALVVSPGNVEAHASLGDVARGQGDLPRAKASYEKALAMSPSYSPALLGMGDTLWDLGDRAGAQRHYQTLVSQSSSPPDRAKVRAAGSTASPSGASGSSSSTASAQPAPTTTVRTLTSADFPPAVAPAP